MRIIPRIKITPIPNFHKTLLSHIITRKALHGEYISDFEEEFSKFLGVKESIAVSSGRAGMKIILENLNLKKGSEIIFPAYTLIDLPRIAKKMGFVPVFADVNPDTYNMDFEDLRRKISKNTKVIIATHLFGNPCEIEGIKEICTKRRIHLIEDCTHSLGAEYKGKKIGTFGTAAFFSFETMKQINTLGGGMVVTNDGKLAEKIREDVRRSELSISSLLKRILLYDVEKLILETSLYYPIMRLLHSPKLKRRIQTLYQSSRGQNRLKNFGFTNLQAKFGMEQMKNLTENIGRRNSFAKLLNSEFKNKDNFSLINKPKQCKSTFYNYLLNVNEDRDVVIKELVKMGIDAVPAGEVLENVPKIFGEESFKGARKVEKMGMKIPIHHTMSEEDIKYILTSIKSISGSKK